jgi:hypothetical protein
VPRSSVFYWIVTLFNITEKLKKLISPNSKRVSLLDKVLFYTKQLFILTVYEVVSLSKVLTVAISKNDADESTNVIFYIL